MKCRVLIVDDEESMRLFLAHTVSAGMQAEVTLAGTCEQALKFAGTQAYDVILLDLLMPGVGGFGVLSEIRRAAANSPNKATPVIVVSVLSDQPTKDRCMKAGANASCRTRWLLSCWPMKPNVRRSRSSNHADVPT